MPPLRSDWTSPDRTIRLLIGDVIERLQDLPDCSVHCVVTSPPYWGLRDYGTGTWEGGDEGCDHVEAKGTTRGGPHSTITGGQDTSPHKAQYRDICGKCGARRIDKQLGNEPTPEEYVARMVEVFREVRRVLRDDGTCWLNLGDSYTAGGSNRNGMSGEPRPGWGGDDSKRKEKNTTRLLGSATTGVAPKNLVGIPWSVAKALQQPYYTGTIKDERDRIWLAAMTDAEGCMFIHKRKAGHSNGQGYERQNDNYAPGLEVANTNEAIVQRCLSIVGKGSICSQSPEQNARRKQTIYRWNLRTTECRDIVREIYPHLTAKQQQARLLCGCPSSGKQADAAHQSLISLHNGGEATIDFPAPQSMFEPGWYLRSEIIWAKPNPMPESVTDRPTKSHEQIFLLTKRARYFYDAEAVKEESVDPESHNGRNKRNDDKFCQHDAEGKARTRVGFAKIEAGTTYPTRNRRSVWTIATKPYSGAHFATFPPDLIIPCIQAGTSERGVCSCCGAPWERVVDKDSRDCTELEKTNPNYRPNNRVVKQVSERGDKGGCRTYVQSTTTGWQPTCNCPPSDPIPATVLDPFGGSGTTAQVSRQLNRHAILIELNPAYANLAKVRVLQRLDGEDDLLPLFDLT
jgi:DNA modification methylase